MVMGCLPVETTLTVKLTRRERLFRRLNTLSSR